MSHKKRASTALKSMGAAGLAAATIVSGLSFGAPALASEGLPLDAEGAQNQSLEAGRQDQSLEAGTPGILASPSRVLFQGNPGQYFYDPSIEYARWTTTSDRNVYAPTMSFPSPGSTQRVSNSNYELCGKAGLSVLAMTGSGLCVGTTTWSMTSDGLLYITSGSTRLYPGKTLKNYTDQVNGDPRTGLALTSDPAQASRLVDLQQNLVANVSSVNHAAKSAVVSGTATPGGKVTIGSQTVDVNASGAWSMTVTGLAEGANTLIAIQTVNNVEIDRKNVVVTINNAAIIGQDGAAVALERGETVSVESLFKTDGSVSRPQGKVEFTAPEGTTFTEDQGTIEGSFKKPGEDAWTNAAMTLTNGVRSEDGTKYTYDFATTTTTWNLPDASLMRWNINVDIPEDAEAGTFPMRTVLSGTAVEGAFNTTSTTQATIDEAVNPVAPIVVETPANGSTVTDKRPVFSGTGDEGATIEITGATGRVVATTTVKDGKWSVPASFDLNDSSYALTATQTPLGGEKSNAPINFVVKAMVPVTLTAPAIGSDVSTPNPVFQGRGTPGATVVVKGTYGSVLATTEVKADGTWTVPSAIALATGSYAGTATQTVDGKTTTAAFRFTVGQNLAPVTLETPAIGAEVTDTKPVFTGEGQPGATVEVKGTYGTLLATAVVKDDGTWKAPSDITLANGQYAGKAWQTVNGKTTSADFRFTVVQAIAPVTLETPAIGAEVTDTKPVFTGEG
ncbi:Ig-like domain-containing protein, partial [Curtobacterium flaccumfaciens]|uniref:Ig-like domain-containing protein n=1 Tax=Curtobacterium flaccumfaciens TaxID=2035 RepID=UPI003F81BFD2